MPAIQVLGCCSRLGTWSTACRGAGFLPLSSETCWDSAGGSLRGAGGAGRAEDAAGVARSTVPCPASGSRQAQQLLDRCLPPRLPRGGLSR